MRTKVLVGLAALTAGALTASAQNVYSLNVVGYINLPLVDGFNMVANQLDADGTGTNNTVSGVFGTNLPVNTAIYTWNGSGYNPTVTYAKDKSGNVVWSANAATTSLNPGQGAWVSIPAGSLGTQGGQVTTVGQVLQGSLVNKNIPAGGGFSILSSMVPLSGGLQTALGYTPKEGDAVYTWNAASQGYNPTAGYSKDKQGNLLWLPSEPTITVGQGFWLNAAPGSSWSNYFTVQ